jgi:hypothetical protein
LSNFSEAETSRFFKTRHSCHSLYLFIRKKADKKDAASVRASQRFSFYKNNLCQTERSRSPTQETRQSESAKLCGTSTSLSLTKMRIKNLQNLRETLFLSELREKIFGLFAVMTMQNYLIATFSN